MWISDALHGRLQVLLCLGAALALAGCHRRQLPPTMPPVLQGQVFAPPLPSDPVMESALPVVLTHAETPLIVETKPRRPVRRVTTKGTPAGEDKTPVDVAGAGPAEESAVGELSAGGEASPQAKQDAAALILSSERRLNGLSQAIASQQQAQVRRVRLFLRQAKQALSTGDAEGAKTLATKVKLLIDDIAK
jgi:hypothetical protein